MKLMNFSNIQEEVVFLKAIKEIIDSMAYFYDVEATRGTI